jgi:hypothetical protein
LGSQKVLFGWAPLWSAAMNRRTPKIARFIAGFFAFWSFRKRELQSNNPLFF